jgi:hypothetical protein
MGTVVDEIESKRNRAKWKILVSKEKRDVELFFVKTKNDVTKLNPKTYKIITVLINDIVEHVKIMNPMNVNCA